MNNTNGRRLTLWGAWLQLALVFGLLGTVMGIDSAFGKTPQNETASPEALANEAFAQEAAVAVTHLHCEYRTNPVGVDAVKPRLGWTLGSDVRGQEQTAYQILVATNMDKLSENSADLWDSGKVESDQSVHVLYGGQPLKSRMYCYWKIRVWDKDGRPSEWSKPGTWVMGLLSPADWRAEWIGAEQTVQRPWARPENYNGFHAAEVRGTRDVEKWIQIDLSASVSVERIILYPANPYGYRPPTPGFGFPLRFRVEASQSPDFKNPQTLFAQTETDFPNPGGDSVEINANEATARYIRLTTQRLWCRQDGVYCFALKGIAVFSGGRNIALNCPVTAKDSVEQYGWGKAGVTHRQAENSKPEEAHDPLSRTPFAAIMLRREEMLTKPVRRATARICGLGYYEFFINGKRVGDHVLDPAFTDYTRRVSYVTHDVTPHLKQGDNALGVILGGGFYRQATPDLFGFQKASWTAPPNLLLEVDVEYTDGTRQTIASDCNWKWSTGPIVFNCIRGGETYDARYEMPKWSCYGFDDSGWRLAEKVSAPSGRLVSQQLPPIRAHQTITPVKLSEPKPGVWVYDLGVNIAGWVRFNTHGTAGQKVTLEFNELLRPDGTVNTNHLSGHTHGRFQRGELILSGREQDTFEPRFTYHGFRYVQIKGLTHQPTLYDLVGRGVTTDPEPAGSFECSNDGINNIHELVCRTYLNNLHGIPTDCPQREKMGWMNDGRVTMEAGIFNFDTTSFYTKWVHDMLDAQDESGHVVSIVPTCGWGRMEANGDPGRYADPWWGGTIVMAPWVMYQYYGDVRTLQDCYPSMKRFVDYLSSTADDHIVSWFLGDWLEVGKSGRPKRTPIPQTSTCAYYYSASIVHQVAKLLGHDDDARKYADLCQAIKESFNRHFLDADTGLYAPDSQTAQALPLYVGLVPESQQENVFDQLVKNITGKRNGHLSTGIVGTLYLLHVLTDNGRADLAHGIMTKEEFPGWLHMIKSGATSIWEAWDGGGGGSRNHPTFGLVGAFFYRNYAGIRPDPAGPGFKNIIIKPEIADGMDWVRASYRSVHGPIKSEWRRGDGRIEMNIDIPVNTSATVYVPAKKVEFVTESGSPATRANGVRFLRMEDGRALFLVGSGSYSFSSRQW